MNPNTSQIYESFVPIYDTVPEKWEEARPFFVEQLKKISQGVNTREIGFLLQEQLLTGKQFIPIIVNPVQYREVFRKVIDCSPLVPGVNPPIPHNIDGTTGTDTTTPGIQSNFTLIDLWVSATDSVGFTGQTLVGPDVTYDQTNILINSPSAYDRAFAFIEYILEI